MVLTVMSGKGGTGKTTLSVSLAKEMAERGHDTLIADLDVEEPNSGIFFDHKIEKERVEARVMKPEWIKGTCDLCGVCQTVCQFHAIVRLPKTIMVFEELCHSCHACSELCHSGALPMTARRIGEMALYDTMDHLAFLEGKLDVGREIASVLVRQTRDLALEKASRKGFVIFDAPPGTACAARESMIRSDLVLLVAEPTEFGLHDMRLAYRLAKKAGIKTAVIVNRQIEDFPDLIEFCESEKLPVLAAIPYSAELAADCSEGRLNTEDHPGLKKGAVAAANWLETNQRKRLS